MTAQHGRRMTGIDVHPSARIGRRCLMWHGQIMVGEGAVIGDDCVLEPGALLLGGPRVGNFVTIEAGALVSGEIFLGNDVRVLAGAVVSRDIPDGGVAVGVPGRVLAHAQAKPDPDARAVQALAERLYHLEEQLQILAFATRQQASLGERWRTRNPDQYGPIPAVEELIDGAGI
jgi:serine acetyltransferase